MDVIFYNPIVNLFLLLYKLLFENFVLSIIAVTLILQLILWPLTIKQYTASKKMKGLQEKMSKIQEKRVSGEKLTVAETKMAAEAMKGMFAGCLPALVQLPFLLALYDIITKVAKGDGTIFNNIAYSNQLKFSEGYRFHLDFFGLDLSKTIFNVGFDNILSFIILLVIIIITIITQYFSIKMSTPDTTDNKAQEIDATTTLSKKERRKKRDQNNNNNTNKVITTENLGKEMKNTSQQTMRLFTIIISVLSVLLPAALSVYWLARSIFVIILTVIQKRYIIKEK